MTPADQVIARARAYLGVYESRGRNRSPTIDRWAGRWGYSYDSPDDDGPPWCGIYVDAMYAEAGVDDDGIGSPSTYAIYARAKELGRLRPDPVPGCFVVWRPGMTGHVEIAIRRVGPGVWRTIGGNTGDAVREHDRSIAGAYFAVPRALDAPPEPVYRTVYWWEDVDAEPVRHGLYARESYREHAVDVWVARHGNPGHVRRGVLSVRDTAGLLVPRFTFWTGPRRRSPDYATRGTRDASLALARAQRPGHRFITRSRRERIA